MILFPSQDYTIRQLTIGKQYDNDFFIEPVSVQMKEEKRGSKSK